MAWGRVLIVLLGLLAGLAAPVAQARSSLAGSPPIERYAPDLDVFPQNFAITQDSRGIVYVGNTDGVLEFDGERWRLMKLANHDIARSLAMGPGDRLYVGGYNGFGHAERDASGQLRYTELSQRFAGRLKGREFADIWDLVVAPEGVYFRAVRDLFFWDPKTDAIRHWHHEGRFGAIVHHRGRTLLQFRGEGLRQRVGDEWRLLEGTRMLTTLRYELLPLPDGSLLAGGSDGDWYRITGDQAVKQAMPATLPPSSNMERSLVLSGGDLVFASQGGFVYVVDGELKGERHFKVDPGFISGLHESFDGGFLAVADQAIYRIEWPSEWSVLGAEHGAQGSLLNVAHWDGAHYLLSSAGALRFNPLAGEANSPFDSDPWREKTAYDLFVLDPRRALVARDHLLEVIEDGRSRPVSDELVYPRLLQASAYRPGRIYLGSEFGLRSIEPAAGGFSMPPSQNPDQAMLVSSIAEMSADVVWTGSERNGAWRHRLDAAGRIVESRRYAEAEGLPTGPIAEASVLRLPDGGLLASTRRGLFVLKGDRFQRTEFDGLSALRGEDERLRVVASPRGEQWAYGTARLYRRLAGGWRELDVRKFRRGALLGHHFDEDGRAMFVSGQALLLHDPSPAATSVAQPRILLREVTRILADGRREALPLAPDRPVRLQAGDFGIQFQFALPDLSREGGRQYQGRLLGYEGEFSEWSRARGYTYSKVSPGEYQLQVRARDSEGRITEILPYRLVIEPPWYGTGWARLALLVLGLLAGWLLARQYVRARTRRMAEEKRKLEDTVESRTRELADANRRLEMMAHLDGLTGIANRRRLDEYLGTVWEQCRERGRPLSLLAIDVDHFKQFNDRHGHLAGDELLKQLVQRMSSCLRRSEDLLARYGGEEFLAVLPGADVSVARSVAEAMRATVEQAALGATISVGLASGVPGPGTAVTTMLEAADEALYAAKAAGRNRVHPAA